MTVAEEFSRAYTSYAAKPERVKARRTAVLTVLARALGTLLGLVLKFVRSGVVLQPLGLAAGVVATFTVSVTVGLAGLCVALLVLDWLIRSE